MLTYNENVHTINGVSGRMHNRIASKKTGLLVSQKWCASREFDKHGYKKGSRITVELRFDDECKNGHQTFSITGHVQEPRAKGWAMGGCIHKEISKYFPELAHLIKWHLTSTDGPMHYVANTTYHASNRDQKERNFKAARSCAVWHDATDEQLSLPESELSALLLARLPKLIADFKTDMLAIGFEWKETV